MRRGGSLFALAVILLASVPVPAHAQPAEVRTYARPGRPTMTLYVMGAVGNPGIWVVEREATLVEVLALINPASESVDKTATRKAYVLSIYRGEGPSEQPVAGGPSASADSATSSAGEVASEPGAVRRTRVFEAEIDEVLSGERAAPQLRHGDVLSVEVVSHTRWLTFQNVASAVGAASSFVLLLLRLGDL